MLRLIPMGIATVRGWLFVGPCWAGHGRDGCGGPGRPRWAAPRLQREGVHEVKGVRYKGIVPDCKKSWGEVLEPLFEHVDHLDGYLEALSEEQKRAVWDDHKTVRVVAGPGSGKTRVLAARVARLLLQGVHPENVMVLTFTNKAAYELKDRLQSIVKESFSLGKMWTGTFHGLANRIVRPHVEELGIGLKKNYSIYDVDDAYKVVLDVLMEKHEFPEPTEDATKEQIKLIKKQNSQLKAELRKKARIFKNFILTIKDVVPCHVGMSGRQLVKAAGETIRIPPGGSRAELEWVYEGYKEAMVRRNAVDFSDLQGLCNAILMRGRLRGLYVDKFKHILVDEVQDTNKPQYFFLRCLTMHIKKKLGDGEYGIEKNKSKLFIVGDPNQSIYRFRGADLTLMSKNMAKDFGKDMSSQYLRDNYRSYQAILKGAESVLSMFGDNDSALQLNPMRRGETKIEVMSFKDDQIEAKEVVNFISKFHKEGVDYSEIGVLFRTHHVSRQIEQVCTVRGVPFKSLTGMSFWLRREVKDILCYLRFMDNPDDIFAFERIVNTPTRGIGAVALEGFQDWASETRKDGYPGALVDDLRDVFLTKNATQSASKSLQQGEVDFDDIKEDMLDDLIPKLPAPKVLGVSRVAWKGLHSLRCLFVFLRSLVVYNGISDAVNIGVLLGAEYAAMLDENSQAGDPEEKLRRIQIITQAADQVTEEGPGLKQLEAFVQNAVLWSEEDMSKSGSKVSLATMHAAKGLEFKVVFIVGFEEGLIPHEYDGSIDLPEETRLAFVAMSRAKDRLYLTLVKRRNMYKPVQPEASRYLQALGGFARVTYH